MGVANQKTAGGEMFFSRTRESYGVDRPRLWGGLVLGGLRRGRGSGAADTGRSGFIRGRFN